MYTNILRSLQALFILIILVSAYWTYLQVKQTGENMKMYTCDAYSLNRESAPVFCN
jgi:hypothetical protein